MTSSTNSPEISTDGILPDLLIPALKLVFCGTAPSHASAAKQAYYAHPGNYFWLTLYDAGFIPEPLQSAQYRELLKYGIGLTDLNKQQHGVDSTLDKAAFDIEGLRRKLEHFQPRLLAFTSKHAGQTFLGNPKADYGLQPETVGNTQLWILPSTSGNARPHWPRLKPHWFELAALLQSSHHVF